MIIAITAQGSEMTSEVDPRFGRAKHFVVIDMDTGEPFSRDNAQNLQAVQGAGIQAARNIIDLGVEVVITGNVGPRALTALRAGGVGVYTGASGTVAEAIEQFKAGELDRADDANVEGHW